MMLSALNSEDGTGCVLFPSLKTAEACCSFVFQQSSFKAKVHHITEVFGIPLTNDVFALLFPEDQRKLVMTYWMFSGAGISPRFAEQCLLRLSEDEQGEDSSESKLGLPRSPDHAYYEYYQKHIPLSSVNDAKIAIRTRYAGILQDGSNIRGVSGVSTDDVFLYPNGMAAIWNCHQLLAATIASKIGPNTLKNVHIK